MGYFVTSKRISDRIKIGDDIEILISDILSTQDGVPKVDIAIKAPKNLKIQNMLRHSEEVKLVDRHRNKLGKRY
jgi:sRNA-binding carbon storage regulator CsrA